MALNLKPFIRTNNKEGTIEKIVPYLAMTNGDEATIFLQEGKAYGAGGHSIRKLPDWAKKRIEQLNPKVRAEVGWNKENGDSSSNK